MAGLSDAIGELFVKVSPDTTGFGTKLKAQTTAQAKGAAGGIGSNAGKAVGGALAVGAAGAFAKGVGDFVDFERGLNEVFTLIPDAGEAAFGKLTEQVKDFAAETGNLPQDVIKPLYDSISAGVPQDNAISFLEDANKFAKAGATDLATAVDALTTGVNAFGLEADETSRLSDSLFTAVRGGKTTVDELAASLFQVAPVAATMGVELEDVNAAFATLTAQGTPTRQVATQLKAAFAELGKEGTKADKAFRSINEEGFTAFIEGGGDMQGAIAILQEAANEGGKSLLDMFGSIEAGQAILGLSGENADSFAEQLEAQAAAAGATEKAFEQMEKGIGPALDKLKARFAVVFLELGTTLAPVVEDIGLALAEVVGFLAKLPGPVVAGIVAFAGLAGAMLALSGPILRVIKIVKLLNLALLANPWVLLAAAAVAAIVLIYKNWDKITAFFSDLWDKVTAVFDVAVQEIGAALSDLADWFSGVWDTIKNIVGGALDFIEKITRPWVVIYTAIFSLAFNALSTFLETWAGRLQALFTNLFNWLTTATEAAWGLVTAVWDAAFAAISAVIEAGLALWQGTIFPFLERLQALFQMAWNAVTAIVQTAFDVIGTVVSTGVNLVSGLLSTLLGPIGGVGGALEAMKNVFQTVWDQVKSIMQGAYDFVVDMAQKIGDAVSSALGPVGDIAGAAGGLLGGAANLLGFDTGGVVPGPIGSAQLAVVHGGETILPTHKNPSAGMGNVTNNFMMDNVTIRDERDITLLARELAREQERALVARVGRGNR